MTATAQRRTSTRIKGGEVFKYLVSLVILASGVGIMGWLYTLKKPSENTKSDVLIPSVKTFDAQPYSGQLDLVVSGSVVPFREIRIAAEVGGRILNKYPECEAGNFVKKGTPLLKIDPEDYRLDLISIEADVNQAEKMLLETEEELRGSKRNIELAQNEYQLQLREFNRNKRLRGVVSTSEMDVAERGLLASKTQLTARKNSFDMLVARRARMEASLKVAQSRLDKSRLNLQRTTIVAPDDGVIVREMVEKGDYVAPGTQLVMFEDTSRAEVLCNLTTFDLDWIREHSKGTQNVHAPANRENFSVYQLPQTPVAIYERGEPDVVWQGILERFDGIGRDELTKTTPCRIAVSQPIIDVRGGKRALVRNMYVKCRMEVQTSAASPDNDFIHFPETAVRPGNYIWVVRDEKIYRLPVDIIDRNEGFLDDQKEPFVVVSSRNSDLKVGDQIVVSPLSQPTEGSTVLLSKKESLKEDVQVEETSVSTESSDDPTTS